MVNSLRSKKSKLLILAMLISLIVGAFTVTRGDLDNVYHFGFPSTFITLNKQNVESVLDILINPIQFVGNIIAIWLILFYLDKIFRKIALIVLKEK
jgi:hypothetical protein